MDKYNNMPQITKEEVHAGLQFCADQILKYIPDFSDSFPSAASESLFYKPIENNLWTTGFWPGEIWLAYEFCGNKIMKEEALKKCDDFEKRICERIAVDDHDMGFLYSLSCVAAYKIIGDEKAKNSALMAAENLYSRFRIKGEFIQAWGTEENEFHYGFIIDCLMNLGLLYWASEVTGDKKYQEAALKHFHTAYTYAIREDGSSRQAVIFDTATGEYKFDRTNQGYSDDSAWSRGQSWAVYGPAITYKYTKDDLCMTMFRKAADYFMNHLPEDMIPYFDLVFTEGNKWPLDSSAGAIAASGMLEMSKYLEEEEAAKYVTYAKQIAKSLYDKCMVKNHTMSNGILLHSTYCCETPYNKMKFDNGKDECCSFGDYFYMELLTRLNKDWDMYW